MNKSELIETISSKTNLSKKDSQVALDALCEAITDTLVKGDKISLVGFGTFETRTRAERKGRNPQTGAEVTIPSKKVPVFKAGKSLKDLVKNN